MKIVVVRRDLLEQIRYEMDHDSRIRPEGPDLLDEIERILSLPEPEGLDPDCRDGKHGSCTGCPGCPHHQIVGDRPYGLEEGEAWDERLQALVDLLKPA